jgi:hypothetical protein
MATIRSLFQVLIDIYQSLKTETNFLYVDIRIDSIGVTADNKNNYYSSLFDPRQRLSSMVVHPQIRVLGKADWLKIVVFIAAYEWQLGASISHT